jgi:hypothetical protein
MWTNLLCISHNHILVHLSCHSITKTKQGPFSGPTPLRAPEICVVSLDDAFLRFGSIGTQNVLHVWVICFFLQLRLGHLFELVFGTQNTVKDVFLGLGSVVGDSLT